MRTYLRGSEKKAGTFAQGRGPQFCKQVYAFLVRTSPYILSPVKHTKSHGMH